MSPIARLAIVGSNGMGALEYVPEIPLTSPATSTDFDELAQECANVLAADGSQDLDTLFAMGGSSGGARPKVLISIDGEDWIVKFASSQDDRDIGESEYRYALAAKACGIDMPKFACFLEALLGLFRRTPRSIGPRCIGCCAQGAHVSAGALLETSHRIPNLDYETLMRLTLKLTDSSRKSCVCTGSCASTCWRETGTIMRRTSRTFTTRIGRSGRCRLRTISRATQA